jgi:hypothetical protein
VSHNLIGRLMDEQERSVIAHLLSVAFNGAAELREQLAFARVVENWKPEGSASFDISVPAGVGTAQNIDGVAPVNAYVTDEEGAYVGELILWIENGKLAGLEYAWVTDSPPSRLPEVSQIRVSPK